MCCRAKRQPSGDSWTHCQLIAKTTNSTARMTNSSPKRQVPPVLAMTIAPDRILLNLADGHRPRLGSQARASGQQGAAGQPKFTEISLESPRISKLGPYPRHTSSPCHSTTPAENPRRRGAAATLIFPLPRGCVGDRPKSRRKACWCWPVESCRRPGPRFWDQ